MPTNEQVAWLAGLFEGEGHISLRAKTKAARNISIQMCDQDVIERVHSLFGGAVYLYKHLNHPKWKPAWVWVLGKQEAVDLLKQLQPHFGQRRGARALVFMQNYQSREMYFAKKTATTNKRLRLARQMVANGRTYTQVAQSLGITRGAVATMMSRHRDRILPTVCP